MLVAADELGFSHPAAQTETEEKRREVRGVSEEPSASRVALTPQAESPERRTKTSAAKRSKVQQFHFHALKRCTPSLLPSFFCCLSLISPLSLPPPLPVSRSAFSHFLEVAEPRKTPRIPGLLREEAGLQLLMSLCCCR